jgi:hypothetical protein
MTRRTSLHCTAAVFCLFTVSAFASDWVAVKSAKELREIYANNTLKGNGWISHYTPDGKGVMILQNGNRIARTWQVKGNDQVCATLETGTTNCFRIQRHKVNREQIVLTNVADSSTFMATIEKGVPKF